MSNLFQMIARLGLELHPARIAAISGAIAELPSPEAFGRAKSSFGPTVDPKLINRLEKAWLAERASSPAEVAAALRGASEAAVLAERRSVIELVWTGPSTGMVPVRHTEQVLRGVIEEAKERLLLISFVAYEVEGIVLRLNESVRRGVRVDLLLESSIGHGGKLKVDSVHALKEAVPGANVHIWSSDSKKAGRKPVGASVHAKCAVADGRIAFVTSANLTAAAMENNMEVGILVRGGVLPDTLDRHLSALITTGIVERV